MDTFVTNAKIWPSGLELNQGIDSNQVGGSYNPTRQAPLFASDGATTYQFLFWNTGRRLTSKRNVRWMFSVFGWGVWTATRWYGIPGGPGSPGSNLIRANAFSIGGNQSLGSATPIDAAASTFPAGAHPVGTDDHLVSTANGAVSVAAKDPYDDYDFAGWLQIIMGGDDTSEFIETDSGSGGTIGGVGFYDHVTGGAGKFQGLQNSSADLLATYGYHPPPDLGRFVPPDRLRDWIYEVFIGDLIKPGPEIVGDPSPIDRIRGKLLQELIAQARPGSGGATDFQSLIEAAPKMNPAELKRAVQQLKTTLDLGNTALGALEARLKGK